MDFVLKNDDFHANACPRECSYGEDCVCTCCSRRDPAERSYQIRALGRPKTGSRPPPGKTSSDPRHALAYAGISETPPGSNADLSELPHNLIGIACVITVFCIENHSLFRGVFFIISALSFRKQMAFILALYTGAEIRSNYLRFDDFAFDNLVARTCSRSPRFQPTIIG